MARLFLRQRFTSYCGLRRVQQSNRSRVLAKIHYSCNTLWRYVSAVMSFISSQRSAFWRNLYIYIYLIAWAHRGNIIFRRRLYNTIHLLWLSCPWMMEFLKHYLGVDEIMINDEILWINMVCFFVSFIYRLRITSINESPAKTYLSL